jgi:hypothetical protein
VPNEDVGNILLFLALFLTLLVLLPPDLGESRFARMQEEVVD